MNPQRIEKFKRAISRRQPNITVILENVYDLHNVGAAMRSCESVGIMEIFVLFSEKGLTKDTMKLGRRTSAGTRRWVDVHYYEDVAACFQHVRNNYEHILATKLDEQAVSLYDLDLTQSVALLFGNERDGVSKQALAHCNGNFIIPQMGMVQSLNLSVACAITCYEALRQRQLKGFYDQNPLLTAEQQADLLEVYIERCKNKDARKTTHRIS